MTNSAPIAGSPWLTAEQASIVARPPPNNQVTPAPNAARPKIVAATAVWNAVAAPVAGEMMTVAVQRKAKWTPEQFEFVMAIQMYKKVNKRMFPTWTEVLEVVNQLGYRKVLARDITLENVPEPEIAPPISKVA